MGGENSNIKTRRAKFVHGNACFVGTSDEGKRVVFKLQNIHGPEK